MRLLIAILGVVALAAPAMAVEWAESGDAGDLPATAQNTNCTGALTAITGTLTAGANDADMYCIHIDGNYGATACGGAAFDTQLALFQTSGIGVAFDDDSGCGLQSTLGLIQPAPGNYLLAISGYDKDPANGGGLEIWADTPFGAERPPDGPGAPGPIAGWVGSSGGSGGYRISLQGVSCCGGATAVEPTTWGAIKNIYHN